MKISVVFYVYNEEEQAESVLLRSVKTMRSLEMPFEIVFIDDGSTDKTAEIVERLSRTHPEIKVYRNVKNLGTGPSALRGFELAQGDLIIHNGIDYPFDLADLKKMIPLLDEADIVVAARKSYAGYTPYRRAISSMNILLLQTLFGLRLRDYNFTQLYKAKVLKTVKVRARSAGFIIPETLLRAHELGFKIKEIEIDYHARKAGVSTCGKPRVVLHSFLDLITFRLEKTLEYFRKRHAS